MIRFGYRTPGLRELSFRQKAQLAADLGLPVIEVGRPEFATLDDCRELRDACGELGVEVTSVGGSMNLCDPALEKETTEQMEFALDACEVLDAGIFFTRVMDPAPGVPQAETWETCTRITRMACERSAERGIRFALEADPPCFVHTLERVERLMELVDHPNLWINYDPTNYYVVGSDPLLVISRHADRIINGHVKDAVYHSDEKAEHPVGTGEVPYAEIFRALLDHNLDIAMHIEHCRTVECVTEAAAHVKQVMASL
ncbi:MAG: sugar phosphate isomerase/epimerase [Chloroflexota bacterium]|nr:sugar phosphate isomerase/epimerase [Chloroflexota bacterium]